MRALILIGYATMPTLFAATEDYSDYQQKDGEKYCRLFHDSDD
jgi:hypothetical protein